MRRVIVSRPMAPPEDHRPTSVEILFDLVLVFALTRITEFMGRPPTPLTVAQGLLLLLGFWFTWTSYTWLNNQARADVGVMRAGQFVAMAAIFMAALVIPQAWQQGGAIDAPLILALTYIVVQAVHLALYFYAAAGDRQLRGTLLMFATWTTLAWVPFLLGALLGGAAQTLLWVAAFVIAYGGAWTTSTYHPWQVRSPSHFAERHDLIMIIAIGESIVAVGAGAGTAVTEAPVMAAALLGLIAAICLWWLYFANAARAASRGLAATAIERRGKPAGNGYSLSHIPLIAGILLISLGIEEVIAHVAESPTGRPAGAPLDWISTTALYGGAVLFLGGRITFLRSTVGRTAWPQVLAVGLALLLLPAARSLPALVALGLLTAFLAALASAEHFRARQTDPTAADPIE